MADGPAAAAPGAAALGVLGDPTRRRVLALLAGRELAVGELVELVAASGTGRISQPAVSQHLRVLLEAGLVAVRAEGARRRYRIEPAGVEAAQAWLAELLVPGARAGQALDALATEVARGRSAVRRGAGPRAAGPEGVGRGRSAS